VVRVQARITLPESIRGGIDAVRARWNPERAAGNPAHLTIAYHDEAPDPRLLAERLRCAAERIAPFRLVLGSAMRFSDPVRGVYLAVEDPTSSVGAVRDILLAAPFTRRSRFGLHVTLLHPDQGDRLEEAWPEFSALPGVGSFEVRELQLVGPRNETLMAVGLSGA
jgi:2'-5' RNA ligase